MKLQIEIHHMIIQTEASTTGTQTDNKQTRSCCQLRLGLQSGFLAAIICSFSGTKQIWPALKAAYCGANPGPLTKLTLLAGAGVDAHWPRLSPAHRPAQTPGHGSERLCSGDVNCWQRLLIWRTTLRLRQLSRSRPVKIIFFINPTLNLDYDFNCDLSNAVLIQLRRRKDPMAISQFCFRLVSLDTLTWIKCATK